MLHRNPVDVKDISVNPETVHASNSSQENNMTMCVMTNSTKPNTKVMLLSTALVKVVDKWKQEQSIDSGCMSNLLTVECCKKLGLKQNKVFSNIKGIGEIQKPVIGKSNLTIHSRADSKIMYSIEVLLVEKITNCFQI